MGSGLKVARSSIILVISKRKMGIKISLFVTGKLRKSGGKVGE